MPYTLDSPPDTIKNIPKGAQKIWIDTFNAVLKDGGTEDDARRAGWSNVKKKYHKDGDKWVANKEEAMEKLIETMTCAFSIMEKESNGEKYHTARFLTSRGDEVNGNKRVYPTSVWVSEAQKIKEGKKVVLGQSGHPTGIPDLLDTFLKFETAEMIEKDFYTEARIAESSRGKDFIEIAKAGIPITVSTRGRGEIKKEKRDGVDVGVVTDYELEGIDVLVPGTQSFKDSVMVKFEALEPEVAQDVVAETATTEPVAEVPVEVVVETPTEAEPVEDIAPVKEELKKVTEERDNALSMNSEMKVTIDKQANDIVQLNSNVDSVTKELNEVKSKLSDKETELSKSEEHLAAIKFLIESVQGEKFCLPLITKLQECASKQEVETKLPVEKAALELQLTKEVQSGKVIVNEKQDKKEQKRKNSPEVDKALCSVGLAIPE